MANGQAAGRGDFFDADASAQVRLEQRLGSVKLPWCQSGSLSMDSRGWRIQRPKSDLCSIVANDVGENFGSRRPKQQQSPRDLLVERKKMRRVRFQSVHLAPALVAKWRWASI